MSRSKNVVTTEFQVTCDLSVSLWYTQKAEDVQACRCRISGQDRCLSKSITQTCERDGSGEQRHSQSFWIGMNDRKEAREKVP